MDLVRLVVAIVNQVQTITSKRVEPNDANGKIRVYNSDGTSWEEFDKDVIDWPNCGYTVIHVATPPP